MLLRRFFILREGEGDNGGSGGGENNNPPPANNEVETLKAQIAAKDAELAKMKKDFAPNPLLDKAKAGELSAAEQAAKQKIIEQDVTFNLSVGQFVKDHVDLLPKEIEKALEIAKSEKYDSQGAKAAAIRDAMVQSFFKVQDHVDMLTGGQKDALDNYLKLTKNGREEQSAQIFASVFEPALEMIKRVKKAEEVGRANRGLLDKSDADKRYENKMIEATKRRFGIKE